MYKRARNKVLSESKFKTEVSEFVNVKFNARQKYITIYGG